MAKQSNLVIVESPAKAKTIEKYLGSGYKVIASMGHLRDLPKSTLGVDIENNFEPQYISVRNKTELISQLKKEAKKADTVFLATDPDREGEAISWHLKYLLKLDDEKAKRVTFNEITKRVVTESIKNPRPINQNLVDAQQARRVLDRIVGYQLSPLLWKSIKSGLSAGRVQSVAGRLVVDRESEINAFVSQEFWLLEAKLLKDSNDKPFTARFYGIDNKRVTLNNEDEVNRIINSAKNNNPIVTAVKITDKSRTPSPPFITSTLQQEASRRLNMTPRRTMSIAQQLYEGMEISGYGSIGLITYMRTDSLRLSDEALSAAKDFIIGRYGEKNYPGSPRKFNTNPNAQDAHEAIRPTDVNLTPDKVKGDLTGEQYRLYRLIWSRYVACQMSNALYKNVSADIMIDEYCFKASSSDLVFPGYTSVYEETRDEKNDTLMRKLPELNEGDVLKLEKLIPERQFTQPPSRYTEATLIKAMEEKGIGRPSTYAPTISTILSHNYVVKDGKYLKPTALGTIVNDLLIKYFPDIVDLTFTNEMESELDAVGGGQVNWKSVISDFYSGFSVELNSAKEELTHVKITVPEEYSDEICDVCGRQMVYKNGKFGRFLACSGFPECTFTKPIVLIMPGKCPNCGGNILKRSSKKGHVYYSCERGKDCGFITWNVPTSDNCPACGKTMFKPSGRGQQRAFCINTDCPEFVPEESRKGKSHKNSSENG